MDANTMARSAVWMLLVAGCLFGGAGRFDIPAFWLMLAIQAAFTALGLVRLDPDMLQERIRPGGRKPDRDILLVLAPTVAHWVVAGLDAGRFHWTRVPVFSQAVAFFVMVASWSFVLWAMRVNRFFSSVVRLQADRGQVVVTTGPYRWVRHPGYAGGLANTVVSGIALGSWAAVLTALLAVPFFFYRVFAEEKTLNHGLPGYPEYAERVRYRLIPGLW